MRSTEPQINESIFSLQNKLRDISQKDSRIPPVVPDGIFNTQTENAVKEFQKHNNLLSDGIVDNDTWDKIVSVHEDLTEPLYLPDIICLNEYKDNLIKSGDIADCLFLIQGMMHILALRFENLEDVEISGQHKEDSVNFIKNLQEISNLEKTGDIDVKTYNILAKLYEIWL